MTRTISVGLNPGVVYVSGTVNDTAVIWTLIDGKWQTTTERTPLDIYRVHITAINAAGTSNDFDFTLYYGLHLVTDRTIADYNRLQTLKSIGWQNLSDAEKQEYLYGTKGDNVQRGAYNAYDLNRVETAVQYLADALISLPEELRNYAATLGVAWDEFFDVPYHPDDLNLSIKNDWAIQQIPTQPDMERYLQNVVILRNALEYETESLPADMENLTIDEANNIEKALVRLNIAIDLFRNITEQTIERTARSWFYSNEIFSGEV